MIKKILILFVIITLSSCTQDVTCECEEETTGFFKSMDGTYKPFVTYKEIDYATCDDDGRVISITSNYTTTIRCK